MSKGKELRKPKTKAKGRPVEALDTALKLVPTAAPLEKVAGKQKHNQK